MRFPVFDPAQEVYSPISAVAVRDGYVYFADHYSAIHDRIRGILNKLLVSVGCWDWVMSSQYTRIVCTVIMLPIEILIVCGVTKIILRYFPYIVGKQRVNDGCGCKKIVDRKFNMM